MNAEERKKIIARRDPRYDGRFYFGVRTTRIYCRPTCPAKPKPENIILFKSVTEAEANGFRPCLRCRPDVAPGSRILDGTWNTVSRALRFIQHSTADELNVESLAETLGVTSRHLRRLFDEHLGASPIEIMITQRLHFAKQAVQETTLPISEIAFASGFQSLRRFNEAFKVRFHKSPKEYRALKSAAGDRIVLRMSVHAPYDWDTVLNYLRRHETFGIEQVDELVYRRYLAFGESFGSFEVSQSKHMNYLDVTFLNVPLSEVRVTLARIKILFDTDHNPVHLSSSHSLEPRGIRVPASFEPFETAVSIILSQLVSTEQAKKRLKTLVERCGRQISRDPVVFEFPTPEALAQASLETLGLTRTMAGAIREFSSAVACGAINFKVPVDFADATASLLMVKGIGPWTAQMIAMRCFGNPDAFPATDLIVQRAVEQKIVEVSEWSSLRSYLTHCLWRDYSAALSKKKISKKGTSA